MTFGANISKSHMNTVWHSQTFLVAQFLLQFVKI